MFECVRLAAKTMLSPCEGNRKRGVFVCIDCPGAVVISDEGDDMAAGKKILCNVKGCDRLAQKQGMCKAHAHGTMPRPRKGDALTEIINAEAPVVDDPVIVRTTKPYLNEDAPGEVVDESDWLQPVLTLEECAAADHVDCLSDMRTSLIRTFSSGATRSAGNKPEYAGYLSPRVMEAFGRYMFEHQLQADGSIRDCRNWQKGIPQESYMQSMFRHFVEVWTHYEAGRGDVVYTHEHEQEMITSLMALQFNVQGMAHELLKRERGAK